MKGSSSVVVIIMVFLLILSESSFADTVCVSSATELQTALSNAQSNNRDDEIQVVQGTYYGNFLYYSTQGNNITVKGGYLKKGLLCYFPLVPPSASETILDGGKNDRVLGIYNMSAGGGVAVIRLTIRNGYAIGGGRRYFSGI